MRAAVVQPNGRVEIKDVAGWDGVKKELGGGYLEPVPVGEDFTLYVDEDGIAKKLAPNDLATGIACKMLAKVDRQFSPGDYIKGVAIFIGVREDDDGFVECDLPESVIKEYFRAT